MCCIHFQVLVRAYMLRSAWMTWAVRVKRDHDLCVRVCLCMFLAPASVLCVTECLEELGCLIESNGITVCRPSPNKALKAIAQQIGDAHHGVRSPTMDTTAIAFRFLGNKIYATDPGAFKSHTTSSPGSDRPYKQLVLILRLSHWRCPTNKWKCVASIIY
jgi:hypothetical protein